MDCALGQAHSFVQIYSKFWAFGDPSNGETTVTLPDQLIRHLRCTTPAQQNTERKREREREREREIDRDCAC